VAGEIAPFGKDPGMGDWEAAGKLSDEGKWPVAFGYLNMRPSEQLQHTRFPDGTIDRAYHLSTELLEDLRSRYGAPEKPDVEEATT
jgi:hypothetical protein